MANCSNKPTLVIMAAGMGSRFGGLKQITPVGPNGERIIDYSIYDAIAAGFGKVVFIIKHEIEQQFKENVGKVVAAKIPVEYVYQELAKLPDGFSVPEGRQKPWGTGHAVLCCRGIVNEPFMVINADDFYGAHCYRLLADFLRQPQPTDTMRIVMAGYRLANTMTENGSVSRGVCTIDENGKLCTIDERTRIEWRDGHPAYTEDGETWTRLNEDTVVSMNCWAFPAAALDFFEAEFVKFLEHGVANPMKSEFYLPSVVDALVKAGKADVQVLSTEDRWYGMTYPQDKDMVVDAVADMVRQGKYPAKI